VTGRRREPGEVFAACDDLSTAATVLTLDDGTVAVVSNTRYNPRGYDVRLELHGTADSIARPVHLAELRPRA
jgi:myo-inositol 2-dehydrogenase/D-chiro-inositol 1-dehydrogenase